ncbi:MAG: TIGR03905 family TSCPD domain-containing protein [Oscillospiraceae bacterium]|nr:TIGR03905 family TSCPD domain-containing protein [Oscillospiraceae bacterium]
MTYTYTPRGVCSRQITVELSDDGVIENVRFLGGCNGNTQGVSVLCKGLKAEDAVDKLSGIDCGGRGTSCPDQLSLALKEALAVMNK